MKEFSAQLRFILCGVWSKVCNNQDKDEDSSFEFHNEAGSTSLQVM